MKKILIVFIMLMAIIVAKAQNRTILITESDLPYTNQTWFYSGSGNNRLDESEIKTNWNKGKRITSAAYTSNGWFVTMANETGIGMQTYKMSSDWPNKWIKEKWDEDYYITSISKSDNEWLVVMSKGEGYTDQSWNRANWSNMSKWIKEKWDAGFYITNSSYNGTYWTVVMSKHPKYIFQGYFWATDYDGLKSKIKSNVWDKGRNVQLIEFGGGEYFVVYCKYKENNGRGQNWQVDPSDVRSYIDKRWNQSNHIAYIGSGYPSSTEISSYTSHQSQPQLGTPISRGQTWREELGYGMFAINQGDPNGGRSRTIYRACSACLGSTTCGNCHGMRNCTICLGKGGIISAGYGNYIPCAACGQTGRCGVCHGTGKCICANYEYPGYMAGSTIILDSDGQVIYNSHDYDSGSPSSTGTTSSVKSGTCPKCNGRKYESQSYSYAAASAAGVIPPYHHSGGLGCPYCNSVADHYHYPCPGCMGKGRQ